MIWIVIHKVDEQDVLPLNKWIEHIQDKAENASEGEYGKNV